MTEGDLVGIPGMARVPGVVSGRIRAFDRAGVLPPDRKDGLQLDLGYKIRHGDGGASEDLHGAGSCRWAP